MIRASDALTKSGCSASRNYAVELVTPVLEYGDIPLLQEVVRALRKSGGVTGAEYRQEFMCVLTAILMTHEH